jgi:hypothetical protein
MFTHLLRWLRISLLSSLGLLGLLLLIPPPALADGGAPNLAYVAGSSNGISVVDVAKQAATGSISVSGDPHMLQLSLDGRFLYVTQPQLGQAAIIAASTGDTICTAKVPGQPTLLVTDNNTSTFFVASNGASTVTALDMSNCNVKHVFTVPGHVYGLAIANIGTSLSSANNGQLWVANDTSLISFDDVSGKQLHSVVIPGGPGYVSIPPGSSAYATTRDGNLYIVDITSYKVTKLYSGGSFGPMDFDETTGQIYLPDMAHNRLVVLDPVNSGMPIPPEPNRIIPLNAQPNSIAITNDGQLGFAALNNGTVAMLDIPAHQVITIIHVGGQPHFIITGLYPPLLAKTPQEAATLTVVLNIGAYVIVAALLIVPIVLFVRYSRSHRKTPDVQDDDDQIDAEIDKEETSQADSKSL